MSKGEFEKLEVSFHSDRNPLTKQPIDLKFNKAAFELTDMPLFQIAAHDKLQHLKGQANIDCSIKYQVLSDLTAMIGVVKQKKKATGEMENSSIRMFTKKELAEQERARYEHQM
jgi:hypothetical protein